MIPLYHLLTSNMLFVLPMVFYLARRGASSAARSLEARLRLSGYRAVEVYLGRLVALLTVGTVIAVP